jgi:hypothetical protein
MFDIWPALPIVIDNWETEWQLIHATNIIAALEQHNRVYKIDLRNIPSSLLETISEAMEVSFPALTHLYLRSAEDELPVLGDSFLGGSASHLQFVTVTLDGIPLPALPNLPLSTHDLVVLGDSFLGGSASHLQYLTLDGIPFPALPNLLLSTHDLVVLHLFSVPSSGYISPEAMVACLSTLNRLEQLSIEFRSPQSRAERETRHPHPPSLTRVVLHALTHLGLKGDNEYLEDIVSRIDTPLLANMRIRFFNQLVLDTPLLSNFIGRTVAFKTPLQAYMSFSLSTAVVAFHYERDTADQNGLELAISYKMLDQRLSSLAQVCSSLLHHLPTSERLEIRGGELCWYEHMEHTQWVELLLPFTSVKVLAVSGELLGGLVALRELSRERVTRLLPALHTLFLGDSQLYVCIQDAVDRLVATRKLSGHPVNVYYRDGRSSKYVPWEAVKKLPQLQLVCGNGRASWCGTTT